MTKTMKMTLVLAVAMALTGCSHKPTLGEKMIAQGSDTSTIGKQWVKGDHLIAKGHKRIAKGESLIKKGKSEISAGESMIKKGTKLKKGSEKDFNHKFPEGMTEQNKSIN